MEIQFRELKLKNHVVLNAFSKNGVRLGEVRCSYRGYISNFRVYPAFRKNGVGRQILSHLIYNEALPSRLWLHAKAGESPKYQEKLESLYASLGFNKKGTVPQGTIMVLNRADLVKAVIVAHFTNSYEG